MGAPAGAGANVPMVKESLASWGKKRFPVLKLFIMRHLLLSPGIIGLFLITLVDAANVTRVSSSSAQDGNTATQALNSGSSSRWSAEGRGQWMQLEIGRASCRERV